MRNLLGGIFGAIAGALILNQFALLEPITYPDPYQSIALILTGSAGLQATLVEILNPNLTVSYIVTWFIIGSITGVASVSKWNSIRTALWVGVITGLVCVASILLTDVTFWPSPDRNISLAILFASTIIASLLTLPTAIMVVVAREKLQQEQERPPPDKIETVCACGAVYKSKPLMCSECGAILGKIEEK